MQSHITAHLQKISRALFLELRGCNPSESRLIFGVTFVISKKCDNFPFREDAQLQTKRSNETKREERRRPAMEASRSSQYSHFPSTLRVEREATKAHRAIEVCCATHSQKISEGHFILPKLHSGSAIRIPSLSADVTKRNRHCNRRREIPIPIAIAIALRPENALDRIHHRPSNNGNPAISSCFEADSRMETPEPEAPRIQGRQRERYLEVTVEGPSVKVMGKTQIPQSPTDRCSLQKSLPSTQHSREKHSP
jgi:hypothetical protein